MFWPLYVLPSVDILAWSFLKYWIIAVQKVKQKFQRKIQHLFFDVNALNKDVDCHIANLSFWKDMKSLRPTVGS